MSTILHLLAQVVALEQANHSGHVDPKFHPLHNHPFHAPVEEEPALTSTSSKCPGLGFTLQASISRYPIILKAFETLIIVAGFMLPNIGFTLMVGRVQTLAKTGSRKFCDSARYYAL